MAATRATRGILGGLVVVSLEQAVAAPFCTSKLADQGARVIKVERRPQGDFARHYDRNAGGASSYFAWLNRGKESFTADIKDAGDREDLLKLISGKADIFVQNLAPGAAERAGFGSEHLRELNPRLITLDISGYGDEGPRSTYKAYDLLVAAEAGLCDVTGSPEEPGRVGVSICDITTGMNGYAAILQGLYERERTGLGSSYKVSMFDTMAEIMNVPFIQTKYSDNKVKRVGLKHPSIAPYGAFTSKDDRKILISIQNEREWVNLCRDVLRDVDISTDARFSNATDRVLNRDALDQIVADAFSKHKADDLTKLLLESGIAFGELNTVEGLVSHPQLRTCSYHTEEGNLIEIPAPAVQPLKSTIRDVPKLGEHDDAIRDEISRI